MKYIYRYLLKNYLINLCIIMFANLELNYMFFRLIHKIFAKLKNSNLVLKQTLYYYLDNLYTC